MCEPSSKGFLQESFKPSELELLAHSGIEALQFSSQFVQSNLFNNP